MNPPPGENNLFYSLARQIVLYRFDVAPDLRSKFIDYWINQQNFRGLDVATLCFLNGLGIEQPQFLTPFAHEYVREWFVRHDDLMSDRFAAWSCYCLTQAGLHEKALERVESVLARRKPNGSWASELRRTIGCAYPLALSKLIAPEKLNSTMEYIARRVSGGYSHDVATYSQALKTFYLLGRVPTETYKVMKTKLINEGSIFLSHTSQDKPFVRQLAADLKVKGLRVWVDEAELLPGDSLFDKIEGAISEMQYLGVVLSSRSIESAWVRKELRMAQIEELSNRDIKVLPLIIENCSVPLSLRDVVWADFSNNYGDALKLLLRRLAPHAVENDA